MIVHADHTTDFLTVLEEQEGRQRVHTVCLEDFGIGIRLDLEESDLSKFGLLGEIGEDGCHCLAGLAPGCPEIYDNLACLGNGRDVVGHLPWLGLKT